MNKIGFHLCIDNFLSLLHSLLVNNDFLLNEIDKPISVSLWINRWYQFFFLSQNFSLIKCFYLLLGIKSCKIVNNWQMIDIFSTLWEKSMFFNHFKRIVTLYRVITDWIVLNCQLLLHVNFLNSQKQGIVQKTKTFHKVYIFF